MVTPLIKGKDNEVWISELARIEFLSALFPGLRNREMNDDGLVKSLLRRHPGESRGPDVVPAKAGNHIKNRIPVFTGNPGFRRLPRTRSGVRRNDEF